MSESSVSFHKNYLIICMFCGLDKYCVAGQRPHTEKNSTSNFQALIHILHFTRPGEQKVEWSQFHMDYGLLLEHINCFLSFAWEKLFPLKDLQKHACILQYTLMHVFFCELLSCILITLHLTILSITVKHAQLVGDTKNQKITRSPI
jgi:hypothetical protein